MSDDKPLSDRQQRMLAFINEYVAGNGRPPTIREIGKAVDISSTSVVNYNLTKLKERGFLERDAEVSRGLKLTRRAGKVIGSVSNAVDETFARLLRVPLVGNIVAGEPIEAFEGAYDEEDVVELSANMLSASNNDELFALRVNGESMIDAMVFDGDIVVLKKQETAKNGDMVAAWVRGDDTTTLKYFYQEGQQIRLQPANPHMDPIYVDSSLVDVKGKVMMVVRHT
ncbi:MAG: transcriptional repressor LexA [Chloroflexota bacterium]